MFVACMSCRLQPTIAEIAQLDYAFPASEVDVTADNTMAMQSEEHNMRVARPELRHLLATMYWRDRSAHGMATHPQPDGLEAPGQT
eukprot:m.198322 g.198322  ORF g.198322 m.198322 type:complete len:86 (+) comp18741_c0_seq4:1231-1488(+)